MPHSTNGLIPADAVTNKPVVILHDDHMMVVKKKSKLGQDLPTMLTLSTEYEKIVITRVNGVYPMGAEVVRKS